MKSGSGLDKRIGELRKAVGLTQSQLAERIGVSVRTVCNWETDISTPNAPQLWNLSKALDVDPNKLLGWPVGHASGLTDKEAGLVDSFRACTPERRISVKPYVEDQRELSNRRGAAIHHPRAHAHTTTHQ